MALQPLFKVESQSLHPHWTSSSSSWCLRLGVLLAGRLATSYPLRGSIFWPTPVRKMIHGKLGLCQWTLNGKALPEICTGVQEQHYHFQQSNEDRSVLLSEFDVGSSNLDRKDSWILAHIAGHLRPISRDSLLWERESLNTLLPSWAWKHSSVSIQLVQPLKQTESTHASVMALHESRFNFPWNASMVPKPTVYSGHLPCSFQWIIWGRDLESTMFLGTYLM